MTPGQIVTRQIKAYNDRDLEGNMALFSDDFKLIRLSDGEVLIDGKEACREMYEQVFSKPRNLFAEVLARVDFNNKIILRERIHGGNGHAEKIEQLIIFEIVNNKIAKLYRL